MVHYFQVVHYLAVPYHQVWLYLQVPRNSKLLVKNLVTLNNRTQWGLFYNVHFVADGLMHAMPIAYYMRLQIESH